MAQHRAPLKQSDLTRYLKAVRAAGFSDGRVVVRPDGTHEIIVGKVEAGQAGPDPDELLNG
jgi:hypothetical protein